MSFLIRWYAIIYRYNLSLPAGYISADFHSATQMASLYLEYIVLKSILRYSRVLPITRKADHADIGIEDLNLMHFPSASLFHAQYLRLIIIHDSLPLWCLPSTPPDVQKVTYHPVTYSAWPFPGFSLDIAFILCRFLEMYDISLRKALILGSTALHNNISARRF